MMIWFDRLFPALMAIMPALILRSVPMHPTEAADDAAAKERRVYLLTALALGLHAAAMTLFETSQAGRGSAQAGWVMGFSMFAFFHLWFGQAAPALAARSPGWRNPQGEAVQRSASLAPRHVQRASTVPRSALLVGWMLYGVATGLTIWSVVQGLHASILVGLIWWPGFVWGVRAVRTEAEPRDAAGSAELEQAYSDQRRFRAWGFYWLGVLGTAAMSVAFVAAAMDLPGVGLSGAIGGSLIGLVGAVMGTMASFRQAKINGLLHELDHDLKPQGNGDTV